MLTLSMKHHRTLAAAVALAIAAGLAAWPARHAIRHSLGALARAIRNHGQASAGPYVNISAQSPASPASRINVTPGNGQTFYVAPTGDDTAAGTSSAPFKTLQHAADTARAGDTVRIRPGTYTAGMNIIQRDAGSQNNPIAFIAEDGVLLTHAATTGPNADLAAINIEATSGWITLQGFHIKSDGSMQRAGIRITGSDHTQVLDNTVDHAYIGIFASSCSDLLIENNTCENATDQHGIYISRDSKHYIVRGNSLHDNNWDGLHTNAAEGSPNDDGLVENNIIFGNHLSGIDVEGTTNSTFRNNIIYGNGKNGIVLHSQDQPRTPPCTGNLFVNNTIVANGMFCIELAPGGNTANTLFNNILLSQSRTYGSIGISGAPTGLLSDYNAVSDDFSTDLGRSAIPLAAWRSQSSQDGHSLVVSASPFIAPNDFRPGPKSILVNAGVTQLAGHTAPTLDMSGKLRPAAAIDIGALQHPIDTPGASAR